MARKFDQFCCKHVSEQDLVYSLDQGVQGIWIEWSGPTAN